jgi:hypothetical protein
MRTGLIGNRLEMMNFLKKSIGIKYKINNTKLLHWTLLKIFSFILEELTLSIMTTQRSIQKKIIFMGLT